MFHGRPAADGLTLACLIDNPLFIVASTECITSLQL